MAPSAFVPSDRLPARWDPRKVAINHDPANHFLLRPGQILAAPEDAAAVAEVIGDWKVNDTRAFGVTLFTHPPADPADPAKEVLAALARIRRATADRPQGPAKVAPNHVFVGEAGGAITMTGEPRMQGGCGSSVRVAKPPKTLPLRTSRQGDGKGVRIAVLDTGLFDHPWLAGVQRAAGFADVWDVDGDGYADNESGHGTFVAGLIVQVAPAAEVYVVKVLNSMGVGDDLEIAAAMEQLPQDVQIVNLSLGGYTDGDSGPLAIAAALRAMRKQGGVVVAAAGNWGTPRPFWPAAFKQVLAVGAVEESAGHWKRADYSDYGWWVDAAARGTAQQSTFATGKTRQAQGSAPAPTDPTISFAGWASWDGTSFASPITAGVLARLMSRNGLATAAEAKTLMLSTFPSAPQPDFPFGVLVDELA